MKNDDYDIKKIIGFEKYFIDNRGNVYNWQGRLIRKDVNLKGYLRVDLYVKGKRHRFLIHRLVAAHFCTDKPDDIDGMDVHHRDKRITNNHYTNLQIFTRLEHMQEFHGWHIDE